MRLKIVIALTAIASGRAMTLAYIARAGDGGPGDPPEVWLMPLIGDAVIGLAAVALAFLIWKRRTPAIWVVTVVWSAIGAFDAIAAFVVNSTAPWPEFFMLELLGPTMFFAAAAMHLVIVYLLTRTDVLSEFQLKPADCRAGSPVSLVSPDRRQGIEP